MNVQGQPVALLSICIATVLLSACGGGGGGMVRNPMPVQMTIPPPPPPPPDPCPAPINGPCIIEGSAATLTFREYGLSGGRQSDGKLFVGGGPYGGGYVNLDQGEYRFSGGTAIAGTTLVVWDRLVSDVDILHDYTGLGFAGTSELWLLGSVRGNVQNDEHLNLRCWSGLHSCAAIPQQRIDGNYTQLAQGMLQATFGRHLEVTGTATLDGQLLLVNGDAGYVLPAAPSSVLVLHADGGVRGQFAGWGTQSLFLQGALRYGDNDVFFDATRVSLQAAMTGSGVESALTLASAGNLDRAFAKVDGIALAAPDSLTDAQQRLLASTGSVLGIADIAQATRTLDSLSGALHADALQATMQQGVADHATSQRLASMQPGCAAGAWSQSGAAGMTSGFDQWLSPRLLVGVQAGQGSAETRDGLAHSTRLSPQAGAYLRWFGNDGWYAGGSAGYVQHDVALDRTIDLGRGGRWNAHAQHRFNMAGVRGEAGRGLAMAGGSLTPYLALDATALRSERTIEQGGTGFELALQPALQAQLAGSLGLRYGRDWRVGDTGWLRLDADARVQRGLAHAGEPVRAAFVGVPDLRFDLPGHAGGSTGWLDLALHGGFGNGWTWSVAHARPIAGPGADTFSIAFDRRF